MADKKDPTLEKEVRAEALKARFQINAPKFSTLSKSILLDLFQLPFFSQRLMASSVIVKEKSLEAGFSCFVSLDKSVPAMEKAQWGEVVVGSRDEIRSSDDPRGDYFVHARGALPLLMCHFHPSGSLGFSRADCLTANVVVRESMVLLKKFSSTYLSPIFAVAVNKSDSEVEMLLVQRQRSGEFMAFSEAGFGFDVSSWLAAPEFNVGHVQFTLAQGSFASVEILQDQIVQPLR